MPDESSGAEVIELRPGIDLSDEDRLLQTRRRPPNSSFCNHGRYQLDRESQRAFCGLCGREVPLFEVLLDVAEDGERWIRWRKEAMHRAKQASANVDELLVCERNAKARLRRLRKLGATVEWKALSEASRRARDLFPGERLMVFAADEDTAVELRAQLRGSEIAIDPLLGPQCWRIGRAE